MIKPCWRREYIPCRQCEGETVSDCASLGGLRRQALQSLDSVCGSTQSISWPHRSLDFAFEVVEIRLENSLSLTRRLDLMLGGRLLASRSIFLIWWIRKCTKQRDNKENAALFDLCLRLHTNTLAFLRPRLISESLCFFCFGNQWVRCHQCILTNRNNDDLHLVIDKLFVQPVTR